MTPVDLVTIHHEGAGGPTDDTMRFSAGGYTYGCGITRWTWFRSVFDSYATLNFNGVSLDVCFSGNRMDFPVTDTDLTLLRGIIADARGRGYVVDNPLVRAHRNSPGSNTVCPGDFVMARWSEVVSICTTVTPPQPPEEDVKSPLFSFTVPDAAVPADRDIVYLSDFLHFEATTADQLAAAQVFAALCGITIPHGTLTKSQIGHMVRIGDPVIP